MLQHHNECEPHPFSPCIAMLHVLYAPKGEVGHHLHSKKAASCYRSGVPNQRLQPCTGLQPIYAQFHLREQQVNAHVHLHLRKRQACVSATRTNGAARTFWVIVMLE